MAMGIEEARVHWKDTGITPEQILQAVQVVSEEPFKSLDKKSLRGYINPLVCNIARQMYAASSSCYYRTGILGTVLDLLVSQSGVNAGERYFYKSPEDAQLNSSVFQARLSSAIGDSVKRVDYTSEEISEFLHATRGTTCYRLNELHGRYLHILLNSECVSKTDSTS